MADCRLFVVLLRIIEKENTRPARTKIKRLFVVLLGKKIEYLQCVKDARPARVVIGTLGTSPFMAPPSE